MSKKVLQHMLAWAIQTTYQTYKESMKIREDKDMSEEEKTKKLHGSFTSPEYQLLNLILLMRPAVKEIKKEFPDQEEFHKWLDDRIAYVDEMKIVKKGCDCKGCKIVNPIDDLHKNEKSE